MENNPIKTLEKLKHDFSYFNTYRKIIPLERYPSHVELYKGYYLEFRNKCLKWVDAIMDFKIYKQFTPQQDAFFKGALQVLTEKH